MSCRIGCVDEDHYPNNVDWRENTHDFVRGNSSPTTLRLDKLGLFIKKKKEVDEIQDRRDFSSPRILNLRFFGGRLCLAELSVGESHVDVATFLDSASSNRLRTLEGSAKSTVKHPTKLAG